MRGPLLEMSMPPLFLKPLLNKHFMPKIRLIKLSKIKKLLKELPIILGRNAFLSFLVLFAISLIFGGIIFYFNYLLIERIEPEITKAEFKFQSKTYQDVLNVWQEKDGILKKTDSKTYPNPFFP